MTTAQLRQLVVLWAIGLFTILGIGYCFTLGDLPGVATVGLGYLAFTGVAVGAYLVWDAIRS
jgi:hypothetical protein